MEGKELKEGVKQLECPECNQPLALEDVDQDDLKLGITLQCRNSQCHILVWVKDWEIQGGMTPGPVRWQATPY
jgi:hypothetical protein